MIRSTFIGVLALIFCLSIFGAKISRADDSAVNDVKNSAGDDMSNAGDKAKRKVNK